MAEDGPFQVVRLGEAGEVEEADEAGAGLGFAVALFEIDEGVVADEFIAMGVRQGCVAIGVAAVAGGVFESEEPATADPDGFSAAAAFGGFDGGEAFDFESVDGGGGVEFELDLFAEVGEGGVVVVADGDAGRGVFRAGFVGGPGVGEDEGFLC